MSDPIKKVSLQDISGGMQYDKDPRRIPNKAFRNLVNVEYNKRGKLVKSKGYDTLPVVCSGAIKDIQRVLNSALASVGFLIAEGYTRFVSALSAAPTQDHSFSRARSKFLKSLSDRYFYISDDGTGNVRSLRKWYYSSPYGVDYLAGIEVPDIESFLGSNFFSESAGTYILRHGVRDIPNSDNSMILTCASDSPIVVNLYGDHPLIIGNETFIALSVPILTNNLTIARNIILTVNRYHATAPYLLLSSQEVTVNVAPTDVGINFVLGSEVLLNDPDINLRLTISYSGAVVSESLVFYRGKTWLIDSTGTVKVGGTTYTDREIVLGFRVVSKLTSTSLETYGVRYENSQELVGNYIESAFKFSGVLGPNYVGWTTCAYLNLALAQANSLGDISKVSIGRTLEGGGSIYELGRLPKESLTKYASYEGDAIWGFATYTPFPPRFIIDNDPVLSSILLENNYTTPESLNPLMYSLVLFRSRAWLLARIVDVSGITRTFLRYSEVDVFDYWDPLNEISIPDDIIEIQPLREDMMLAWSKNKTYVVAPSGTSFEWLKIADTGIGGSSMSANVGTTEASRFSCATNEAIYWVNDRGAYRYDGSSVSHIPASLQVLSLILEAIAANAIFMSVEKDWAVWLSWSNKILVMDFLNQAFVSQLRSQTILSALEDGSNLYLGFQDGIAQRSADWAEESTALVSTITTKRFAADDLSRVQLYYMGLTYRVKASGTLSLSFEFSTGKIVTKTIDMTVGDYDLETVYLEVYGEGVWFQVTIAHDDNVDFEIIDYTLGATPTKVAFMGEE